MKCTFEGSVPVWLQRIAEGVNYKPGWSLRIVAHSSYGVLSGSTNEPYMYSLAALCTVEDVVLGNPIILHGPGMTLYADRERLDEKMVVEMIFRCIRELEFHEMEEQFSYNGIRIFDPHRERAEKEKLFELAMTSSELQGFRRLL